MSLPDQYNHSEFVATRQIALVTGSSRGIGAAIAKELALNGILPIIHCRDKTSKAEKVAQEVAGLGNFDSAVQTFAADITDTTATHSLCKAILKHPLLKTIDYLILNAAGGLESDKNPNYARQINVDAQINLVNQVRRMELLSSGGKIVYITSHVASAWSENVELISRSPGLNEFLRQYKPVAQSKHIGAKALQTLGIDLVVVTAPLVSDTIPIQYFKHQTRSNPALFEETVQILGMVSPQEVAQATVNALTNSCSVKGNLVIVDEPAYYRTLDLVQR